MLETPESRNYEQYFRFGHDQITIIFLILFADKIYIIEFIAQQISHILAPIQAVMNQD